MPEGLFHEIQTDETFTLGELKVCLLYTSCKSHLSMDLNNPMHAGQWDPDKLPATGGTDDYFIDFLLDQLEVKVPGIVDSGLVSSWLSYRAEPKDFLPILGETPVEGYILATGYGGNGVIEAPAASRDLSLIHI